LLVVDCPHSTPVWTDSGVVVLRNQNIKNGRLDLSSPSYTDEAHYLARIKRAAPTAGDIVITREAPMGDVCQIPDGLRCCLGQRQVLLRPDPSKIDGRFLLFALQSPYIQHQIGWNEGTGSTVSNLRIPVLESLKVPTPPLQVQRDIAITLGALDDRIALLREINATLESIAQALFKSWFVDFDPVRMKSEGRELDGLNAETAGLFPDRFDESDLGFVPTGWKMSTLAEHIQAERGLSYKGAGLCSADEGQPMHNLNSVYEGGGYKYPGIKFYKGEFKERHVARAGDIIVTNTEQGHEHRLIGFPAIVPEAYDSGIFSHHLYRLTIKAESPLTRHVLYYLLMSPNVREQVIGCANGSTVNMLKIHGMEVPRFVCPPATVARAFDDLTLPLRKQMELNVARAQTLASIRDTLLPQLISGRISAANAEALIREAA
jgi:type I restriction enzyme S subunit